MASTLNDLGVVLGTFAMYWIVDLVARRVWPHLLPSALFSDPKSAIMLGRHTMDVVACALFIYLALKAESEPEFKASDEMTLMERLYIKIPTCHQLVLVQVAYQVKNTIDSFMCGDGALFYAHHIGTAAICVFGTYPFMQSYAPFFLGHVEISTVLLCMLGLFDDDHGVVGLGAMYPKTKVALGVCFAAAFIPIRCVIWPHHVYYFWLDMLAVMTIGPHSVGVVAYVLVASAALTCLQFYWLAELILRGRKEFGSIIGLAQTSAKHA